MKATMKTIAKKKYAINFEFYNYEIINYIFVACLTEVCICEANNCNSAPSFHFSGETVLLLSVIGYIYSKL